MKWGIGTIKMELWRSHSNFIQRIIDNVAYRSHGWAVRELKAHFGGEEDVSKSENKAAKRIIGRLQDLTIQWPWCHKPKDWLGGHPHLGLLLLWWWQWKCSLPFSHLRIKCKALQALLVCLEECVTNATSLGTWLKLALLWEISTPHRMEGMEGNLSGHSREITRVNSCLFSFPFVAKTIWHDYFEYICVIKLSVMESCLLVCFVCTKRAGTKRDMPPLLIFWSIPEQDWESLA